ncbi:hypothetical protein JZ751_001884 [Albula glossodonta]|uniref:Uncharacterized protein n=1 Tax=Albula glossodonta TaxID=121402 RepID=A0A8T2P7D2_9TELE|nr:hypothetical protein JZ751_001884 [Albula glossodonta]
MPVSAPPPPRILKNNPKQCGQTGGEEEEGIVGMRRPNNRQLPRNHGNKAPQGPPKMGLRESAHTLWGKGRNLMLLEGFDDVTGQNGFLGNLGNYPSTAVFGGNVGVLLTGNERGERERERADRSQHGVMEHRKATCIPLPHALASQRADISHEHLGHVIENHSKDSDHEIKEMRKQFQGNQTTRPALNHKPVFGNTLPILPGPGAMSGQTQARAHEESSVCGGSNITAALQLYRCTFSDHRRLRPPSPQAGISEISNSRSETERSPYSTGKERGANSRLVITSSYHCQAWLDEKAVTHRLGNQKACIPVSPASAAATDVYKQDDTPLKNEIRRLKTWSNPPLLPGDDEDVVEEEEVDLLAGGALQEDAILLHEGRQLASFHHPSR